LSEADLEQARAGALRRLPAKAQQRLRLQLSDGDPGAVAERELAALVEAQPGRFAEPALAHRGVQERGPDAGWFGGQGLLHLRLVAVLGLSHLAQPARAFILDGDHLRPPAALTVVVGQVASDLPMRPAHGAPCVEPGKPLLEASAGLRLDGGVAEGPVRPPRARLACLVGAALRFAHHPPLMVPRRPAAALGGAA